MKENHSSHLDRLKTLKAVGVTIQSFPNGQNIDTWINREESAIEHLTKQIDWLKANSQNN
jgi:hypothetical protein